MATLLSQKVGSVIMLSYLTHSVVCLDTGGKFLQATSRNRGPSRGQRDVFLCSAMPTSKKGCILKKCLEIEIQGLPSCADNNDHSNATEKLPEVFSKEDVKLRENSG